MLFTQSSQYPVQIYAKIWDEMMTLSDIFTRAEMFPSRDDFVNWCGSGLSCERISNTDWLSDTEKTEIECLHPGAAVDFGMRLDHHYDELELTCSFRIAYEEFDVLRIVHRHTSQVEQLEISVQMGNIKFNNARRWVLRSDASTLVDEQFCDASPSYSIQFTKLPKAAYNLKPDCYMNYRGFHSDSGMTKATPAGHVLQSWPSTKIEQEEPYTVLPSYERIPHLNRPDLQCVLNYIHWRLLHDIETNPGPSNCNDEICLNEKQKHSERVRDLEKQLTHAQDVIEKLTAQLTVYQQIEVSEVQRQRMNFANEAMATYNYNELSRLSVVDPAAAREISYFLEDFVNSYHTLQNVFDPLIKDFNRSQFSGVGPAAVSIHAQRFQKMRVKIREEICSLPMIRILHSEQCQDETVFKTRRGQHFAHYLNVMRKELPDEQIAQPEKGVSQPYPFVKGWRDDTNQLYLTRRGIVFRDRENVDHRSIISSTNGLCSIFAVMMLFDFSTTEKPHHQPFTDDQAYQLDYVLCTIRDLNVPYALAQGEKVISNDDSSAPMFDDIQCCKKIDLLYLKDSGFVRICKACGAIHTAVNMGTRENVLRFICSKLDPSIPVFSGDEYQQHMKYFDRSFLIVYNQAGATHCALCTKTARCDEGISHAGVSVYTTKGQLALAQSDDGQYGKLPFDDGEGTFTRRQVGKNKQRKCNPSKLKVLRPHRQELTGAARRVRERVTKKYADRAHAKTFESKTHNDCVRQHRTMLDNLYDCAIMSPKDYLLLVQYNSIVFRVDSQGLTRLYNQVSSDHSDQLSDGDFVQLMLSLTWLKLHKSSCDFLLESGIQTIEIKKYQVKNELVRGLFNLIATPKVQDAPAATDDSVVPEFIRLGREADPKSFTAMYGTASVVEIPTTSEVRRTIAHKDETGKWSTETTWLHPKSRLIYADHSSNGCSLKLAHGPTIPRDCVDKVNEFFKTPLDKRYQSHQDSPHLCHRYMTDAN